VQRPAAAGLVKVDGADLGERRLKRAGDQPRAVGAAVVRDRDPRGERESVAQVPDEPRDARR